MRGYENPYRARSSEQFRDQRAFLRNFGVGVLDLLPERVWDRLFVIRSAPGGGKTSLLRLLSAGSLREIHARRETYGTLYERLRDLGALGTGGPAFLGITLRLDRDYR